MSQPVRAAPGTFDSMSSPGSVPSGEFELLTAKTVLSAKAHNRNFSKIAPWLRPRIIRGSTDQIYVAGKNLIVQIAVQPDGSSGGADPNQPVPLLFERFRLCHKPALETTDPLQTDMGEWFWAQAWDGVDAGEPIPVAKAWHMRTSRTGRTYRGITSTFTHALNGTYLDWVRTVHVTSPAATYDDETQLSDPPYLFGGEILVVDMGANPDAGGTGVTAALHDGPHAVRWQEFSPMRNWTSVGVDPPP